MVTETMNQIEYEVKCEILMYGMWHTDCDESFIARSLAEAKEKASEYKDDWDDHDSVRCRIYQLIETI